MNDALRVTELRAILTRHDYDYYVLGMPSITDSEYDDLFKELVALELNNPGLRDANSPTQRVGGISPTFAKVKHSRPMLSLEKSKTPEEVIKFFKGQRTVFLEPKIDGLSLKLVYEKGKLVRALTRGDGAFGEDVTPSARTIRNVPLVLASAVDTEIVGEAYMAYSVFNQLNEELIAAGDEPFANTRNAASGTLRLKDTTAVAHNRLSYVAYGCATEWEGITTQEQLTEVLSELGFQTVFQLPVNDSCRLIPEAIQLTDVADLRVLIEEKAKSRKCLDLATDGLVFKINDLAVQAKLGLNNHDVNWATAFKFPDEKVITELVGITVQVGKTGKVTPVAELKPVSLGGSIVRRASLSNQDEIVRLGLNIGDSVYVIKSNEIIPKVVGVYEKKTDGVYEVDPYCPCCGETLDHLKGSVDTYCFNPDCTEQVIARLRYATGKQALDIDGCGQAMVKTLVEHGIRTLLDMYTCSDYSFLKSAARAKLEKGLQAAKKAPMWRKLSALCIEGIGVTKCQDMAERWPSLKALIDDFDTVRQYLGPVSASSLLNYLDKKVSMLEALTYLNFDFEDRVEQKVEGKLSGKTFCVTGTLAMGGRNEFKALVAKHGGKFKDSVVKDLSYLVVAPSEPGSTKVTAAKKFGVPMITEDDFFALIGESAPMAVADESLLEGIDEV